MSGGQLKPQGKLRRELTQYSNCSATAISGGSQAMVQYFIEDAKHDIATLSAALDDALIALSSVELTTKVAATKYRIRAALTAKGQG